MKIKWIIVTMLCALCTLFAVCGCSKTGTTETPPEPTISRHTLTYQTNGGSAVDSVTVDDGKEIQEPAAPKKDGYKFVCWCYDSALQNKVTFPITLTQDTTLYACWNETVNIKSFYEHLMDAYEKKPSDYIPAAMLPGYSDTLVQNESAVTYDYTSFVNVNTINYKGYGEQWKMVVDNITQSDSFFSALKVVGEISSGAAVGFYDYLDNNPSDTAHYNTSFKQNEIDYDVYVTYENLLLEFCVEYKMLAADVQIYMAYDIQSEQIEVRIQLADSQALRYTITENTYTFAIRYLGVRRAYFSVSLNGNTTAGHIYEYVGLDNVNAKLKNCADFYITDDYVSVVGNKANGMTGFQGYINELYLTRNGEFVGYKVMETLTVAGITGTYHTLWFRLSDIDGITSLKMIENTEEKSGYNTYLNNGNTALSPTFNTKLGVKTSRKYDIEMRNFYYYTYDDSTQTYVQIKKQVPLMFIQDGDNFNSFASDIKNDNKISASVKTNSAQLAKIRDDYETLILVFQTNCDLIDVDYILDYIGERKPFTE